MNIQALRDILARALYSEYCDPEAGHTWQSLPENAKDQWRRVAAYVERLDAPEVDQ